MTHEENLQHRHHQIVYCCKLGLLYHRKRERFFDLCDKSTKSLTVVLGASLLADYVRRIAPFIGIAVSAVGLLALVYGYSDRKQRHKELAEAFSELRSQVEISGAKFASSDLDKWHSEMHRINSKEPPSLGTLVVLCQNEIAVEEGKPESVVTISKYKQFFANWRDFHVAT